MVGSEADNRKAPLTTRLPPYAPAKALTIRYHHIGELEPRWRKEAKNVAADLTPKPLALNPNTQATLCVHHSNPHKRSWRRHGVLTDVFTRNVLADTPRILNHPLTRLRPTDNCHRAAAHPHLSQTHVLRKRHSNTQQHSVYTDYFPPFQDAESVLPPVGVVVDVFPSATYRDVCTQYPLSKTCERSGRSLSLNMR